MPKITIERLSKLLLRDWDDAEDQLKELGNYEVDFWYGEPKSACFFELGIEVLISSAAKMSFPDEAVEDNRFRINAVGLYSPEYCKKNNPDFTPYKGEFFRNINFSDSRASVRSKLGDPEYSLDSARYDEYPFTNDCSFQFCYARGFATVSHGFIFTSREVRRRMGLFTE